jgi:hypothetical protein
VPDALKDAAAFTGTKPTAVWFVPAVSTADDADTAATPAPTKLHISRLFGCGDAEGERELVVVTEADVVGDGDDEGVSVVVTDGVCVGSTADAFTAKTKLDSVSVHAEPPTAPVADAMMIEGAVKAVDRGAEMGPSAMETMRKAPDEVVVPLHATVALSCDVGAAYVSATFTVAAVTADDVPFENKLDPVPGGVVDGCASYRPPRRPAKSDCASNTYSPYDGTPKPPVGPKLGAAVESAT